MDDNNSRRGGEAGHRGNVREGGRSIQTASGHDLVSGGVSKKKHSKKRNSSHKVDKGTSQLRHGFGGSGSGGIGMMPT